MDFIDDSELWRQIPPEEKISLLNKSQAAGVLASVISIIVCSTIAVGLKLPWMMWGSMLASPFVFQFASGRSWRALKPRLMLEYLAARSVARRYAFANNSKDLTLALLFRGILNDVDAENGLRNSLEESVKTVRDAAVWVALFNDALVMVSEQPGGARLEFAHLADERLIVEPRKDPTKNLTQEVYLSFADRGRGPRRSRLTSDHPAALIVFEQKLRMIQQNKPKDAVAALPASAVDDADSRLFL